MQSPGMEVQHDGRDVGRGTMDMIDWCPVVQNNLQWVWDMKW